MTTRLAWSTPARPVPLPYNPTRQQLHDKIFARAKPPIPTHGPGIRHRALRRCTAAGQTEPDSRGWATQYCICAGIREVNVNTGKKTRWQYRNTRTFP